MSSPAHHAKPLPPRMTINDADVTVSYLKGTGPGGQKIVCALFSFSTFEKSNYIPTR